MAIDAVQTGRLLSVEIAGLPKDVLLLTGFFGNEEISSLFSLNLELVSQHPDQVNLDQIIGKNATISVKLHDGSERFFNGFINRFSLGGRELGGDERFTHYEAQVVPWLWFLTKNAKCFIHQDRTVPDIIKATFDNLGLRDFRDELTRSYSKWDYCVQYRENDFQFISRLMEQEGIFYFFEHEKGKHTLVLADSPQAHKPCPGQPQATFLAVGGFGEREDTVNTWHVQQELRPGRNSLRDYHFEMPTKDLDSSEKTLVEVGNNQFLEIYDYPGEYAKKFNKPGERLGDVEREGEATTKLRMEADEVPQLVHHGSSTCRAFTAGTRFNLNDPPAGVTAGPYLLTSVQHSASQDSDLVSGTGDAGLSYSNSFSCILHKTVFRPARITPKPTIPGPQTAVVVGPPGEEILVDKYGRVKVQFHWDRAGRNNEQSSCFVRVGQMWAGQKWGSMFTPRIGHEVIVSFLEGDPDQPIITGSVYNAQNMPHYTLPDFKTLSYIKSDSSKGSKGFNELRFEDKKDKEQVFIHSQKRMDVRVLGSLYETVHADRHEVVGLPKGTEQGGSLSVTVGGDHNVHIKGSRYDAIEGVLNQSVKGDAVYDIQSNQIMIVGGNAELNATDMYLEALGMINLRVGASTIQIDSSGITIQGPQVHINSGAAFNGTSSPSFEDPADADTSDTGEPGFLDRKRPKGGGGRKKRTLKAKHALPLGILREPNGDVKVGRNIIIKNDPDHPEFKEKVLRDLNKMNETDGGKRLTSLDDAGEPVAIQHWEGKNYGIAYDEPNAAAAEGKPDQNGNPGTGKGSATTINYDPDFEQPSLRDPSKKTPSDVSLNRAVIEAEQGARGQDDNTPHPTLPDTTVAEDQANQMDNEYRDQRGFPRVAR